MKTTSCKCHCHRFGLEHMKRCNRGRCIHCEPKPEVVEANPTPAEPKEDWGEKIKTIIALALIDGQNQIHDLSKHDLSKNETSKLIEARMQKSVDYHSEKIINLLKTAREEAYQKGHDDGRLCAESYCIIKHPSESHDQKTNE